MKIITLSDLHVDVRPFNATIFDNEEDAIVILPGDICPLIHYQFKSTIKAICDRVKYLLFVPGNHEYYECDIDIDKKIMWDIEQEIPNFILLDNKAIVIDLVKFIGSTLWTDMDNSDWFALNSCLQGMNDFWLIKKNGKKLQPLDTVVLHNEGLRFIEEELVRSQISSNVRYNIVITHHAPSFASIIHKYRKSTINPGFASELSEFILTHHIDYWIHGHTHAGLNYMIGETNIICNPRGYTNVENIGFNPKLTLPLKYMG